MKHLSRRSALFSASLVLTVIGLGTQAQQGDLVAMEQLRKEMTDAVLRALGLDQPPSPDVPYSRRATGPVASAQGAVSGMSLLELRVRRILGFAPPSPSSDDTATLATATPETGPVGAGMEAPSNVPAPEAAVASAPDGRADAAPVAAAAAPAPAPSTGAGTVVPDTAPAAVAATSTPPGPMGQAVAVALDEGTLDTMRGGFVGDGGLRISFGIERAVYINGNLVTTTSLNLSELGTFSAGKAAAMALPDVGHSVALIQSGAGNTVLSNLGPAGIGTVIQNTLNGQRIQTLTTINATVNSLGVLRSIEMQRNLRNAITDSLRR